jgi:poly(A) polymerase
MDEHFQALAIVKTLNQKGFTAYYAGGWVRDFLLNHPSDDIDIATDAPPHIIQEIFPHTIPIGLAFGII